MNNKIFKLTILQILIAIAGAIIYSFISDAANFDWIILGFIVAVVLPLTYLSPLLVKKMGIQNHKLVLLTGMIAVIFGFGARLATQSYILYDVHFFNEEKVAEQEEGSYLSDQDVKNRMDELLRQKTGYSSYPGAFIWYLNNTSVKDEQHGTNTSHTASFNEAVFLWLADLAVGLLALGTGLWAQLAKLPMVCPICGKEKKKKFFIIGPSGTAKQIIDAAKRKDISTLKSLYTPKSSSPRDFVSLKAWMCENCKDRDIEIDFVITKRGRPLEKKTRIPFSPQEFAEMEKIFHKG